MPYKPDPDTIPEAIAEWLVGDLVGEHGEEVVYDDMAGSGGDPIGVSLPRRELVSRLREPSDLDGEYGAITLAVRRDVDPHHHVYRVILTERWQELPARSNRYTKALLANLILLQLPWGPRATKAGVLRVEQVAGTAQLAVHEVSTGRTTRLRFQLEDLTPEYVSLDIECPACMAPIGAGCVDVETRAPLGDPHEIRSWRAAGQPPYDTTVLDSCYMCDGSGFRSSRVSQWRRFPMARPPEAPANWCRTCTAVEDELCLRLPEGETHPARREGLSPCLSCSGRGVI